MGQESTSACTTEGDEANMQGTGFASDQAQAEIRSFIVRCLAPVLPAGEKRRRWDRRFRNPLYPFWFRAIIRMTNLGSPGEGCQASCANMTRCGIG